MAKARITFTNPTTGEYAFYELSARSTMAEVLETVTLESSARQSARTVLTLENPLPATETVTMGGGSSGGTWWSCDSPCVRIKELTPLSGNPEGSFEVEYRPLAPTAQPAEHLVSISTKELGTFKYKLIVTATAAANLPTLRFEAPLGSVMTENLAFKAFNAAKADYACAVKRAPEFFTLPKSVPVEAVSAWEGADVIVPVSFEPTEIGEVKDVLTVTSAGGVEYACEVVATCVAPMPQGPFNVAQGANQDVSFRNFLSQPCAWNFSLDSTAFRTTAPSATVPAKAQGTASVVFEPKEEHGASGTVVTAKLFVKCATKPELAPFIFYLRGVVGAAPAAGAADPKKKK